VSAGVAVLAVGAIGAAVVFVVSAGVAVGSGDGCVLVVVGLLGLFCSVVAMIFFLGVVGVLVVVVVVVLGVVVVASGTLGAFRLNVM
jgi:hypothetical protein